MPESYILSHFPLITQVIGEKIQGLDNETKTPGFRPQ